MISVSLCMIVKNEERVLARCLDSLAGLMDEMVIVDTGSTDTTKKIAGKYGAKIYDFSWTGDFSEARNFAFSKCTKDYIYTADADEVLEEEGREAFRLLKQALLPEIEIVQMKYKNQLQFSTIYNFDEEYRPKLYKRQREFIWQYPIHEAVRLEPLVYDSDVVIMHLPEGEHTSRDLAAFEKMTGQGEHLDKRMHNLYAKELFVSGKDEDYIRAIPFFLESASDSTRDKDEQMEAFCVLAAGYRRKKDVSNFFKFAMKAVLLQGCSEICYELGCFYEETGDLEEAGVWYYNAGNETESILNLSCGTDLPTEALKRLEGHIDS